ncbi:MAG: ribonuclease D [Pseudomonadota bacterium]|nr:MAG: ribonuclease D [Pseudomonadota bacterium]
MPRSSLSTAPPPHSAAESTATVEAAALVDSLQGLQSAAGAWRDRAVVGVDTEFVRERTFFARPGLIQLSDGGSAWLLDAVALPNMPALADLLSNRQCTKILHSVGEDLDVLHRVSGQWPEPLFDTQIAAAMLGMPLQCRYEHLVAECFDVKLAGGQARSNWCKRPLPERLLRYAAEDVVWLPRLHQHLTAELERRDRLGWLEEDCQRLVDDARSAGTVSPLERVRGAGRLDTGTLAWLDALAQWRESAAIEHDLPRRFVISDEHLIELAEAARAGRATAAIRALPDKLRQRHGEALRQCLASVKPDDFERPVAMTALNAEQRQLVSAAQQAVRDLAGELDVDPALIASKKELTRLVRGERPAWLAGWRGAVLADRLPSGTIHTASCPGSSAG